MRTAIILTTYNRPQSVADAIASVLEQGDPSWRLYIMDDGCDREARDAISQALGTRPCAMLPAETRWRRADGTPLGHGAQWPAVVWWQGPARTVADRRATIPYSRTINRALNFLLSDERYVAYICDDDWLMPGSIEGRAMALDANPDWPACYGRLRSVRLGQSGSYNVWSDTDPMARLKPGRRPWVAPTGPRVVANGSAKTYYLGGQRDPETGLDFVDEGFWAPGMMWQARPHCVDHNQLMHRRALLGRMAVPQTTAEDGSPYAEYWPESRQALVGDYGFFLRLPGPFYGVDIWAVTKRYHIHSDGISDAELRE